MAKTILVTGAAGFLGRNLCEALLAQGEKVIGVDNFQTGQPSNIEVLSHSDNFRFIEHDIVEPLYIEGEKLDQIYNLACPASPPQYQKSPIRTVETNVLGMLHMLGLAQAHGATIFQASTSEVYGDPEVSPQTEEYRGAVNPTGPRACYDEGKRVAETLCFDYHRTRGQKIKVARIFNTYGPYMDPRDGRVVSNFIVQALRGDDLTMYGDGSQTRSFCYVDDLIAGFIALMNSGDEVTGPVNLGNPQERTIKELADAVLAMTGSESKIVEKPLPEDDPLQRRPDITKAKELLGWEPKVSFEEGMQKTIEYFKTLV